MVLIDGGLRMVVWSGRDTPVTARCKARLFADKISKNERGNRVAIADVLEGHSGEDDLAEVRSLVEQAASHAAKMCTLRRGSTATAPAEGELPGRAADASPAQSCQPVLYAVDLGQGYLELPQIRARDTLGTTARAAGRPYARKKRLARGLCARC